MNPGAARHILQRKPGGVRALNKTLFLIARMGYPVDDRFGKLPTHNPYGGPCGHLARPIPPRNRSPNQHPP